MPFKVTKSKSGYKVKSPNKTLGTHKTKAAARRQQKAVYANYRKKK